MKKNKKKITDNEVKKTTDRQKAEEIINSFTDLLEDDNLSGKKIKKKIRLSKKTKWIVFAVSLILGGLLGYWLGDMAVEFFDKTFELERYVEIIIGVSIGLAITFVFCIIAPFIVIFLIKVANSIERSLSKYPAKYIFSSVIGLVIGLFIAFLLSAIFNEIQILALKVTINVLVYLVCGVAGFFIGFKRFSQLEILSDRKAEELSKTSNYKLLDSSAIIDGRIYDLAKSGFIEGPFVIPSFILSELRYIADNADNIKRQRGRKALDMISAMQEEPNFEVIIYEKEFNEKIDVDAKLLKLAEILNAKVITNDYNLNKVAGVMNIKILNINELANAIKPIALPGEKMIVDIIKKGKDNAQGLAYLEDGTMVVVENGGNNIGDTKEVVVRTALQTNAGRMIFTYIE